MNVDSSSGWALAEPSLHDDPGRSCDRYKLMFSNVDENVSMSKSSMRDFKHNLNELKRTLYEQVIAL
jgi:hypothetical protein